MLPEDLLGAAVRVGHLGAPPVEPGVDEALAPLAGRLIAGPRVAQLVIDGCVGFQVDEGRSVTVDVAFGTGEADVASWLHGTVAALVLGQQGRTALHASTVAIGTTGVAIAGRRGAGKSTTALELRRRGHRLVTDDVSPVDRDSGGRPTVTAFGRALHVWPETANRLGIDVGEARTVTSTSPKLSLPVAAAAWVALAHVVVLVPDDAMRTTVRTRANGWPAFEVIGTNAYRVELISRLWRRDLFRWTTWLASAVKVHELRRPESGWSVAEVADAIEDLARSS